MDHQVLKTIRMPDRTGFHYFPDCLHYTEKDIQRWLPALKELNSHWLVIQAPRNSAIPEDFIRAISSGDINLVINFEIPLSEEIEWYDLELYLSSYGKWGAKYAILNQHPNLQRSWKNHQWGDPLLINSFVDQFIKFGAICLKNNIKPVFPLLTPGGDYWDLSFLKIALSQLNKNASAAILNNFVLSAAAWQWENPLDWGAGAQVRWPDIKPYKLPKESENHFGFRAYEWYVQIAHEIFERSIPILLLQAGISNDPQNSNKKLVPASMEELLAIIHLLKSENIYDSLNQTHLLNPVSSDVIGCCFFLLSSDSSDYEACQWYTSEGKRLPPAQAIFIREQNNPNNTQQINQGEPEQDLSFKNNRYIYISDELKNDSQKLLEQLDPYIQKYLPLIGNSAEEALQSAVVLAITSGSLEDHAILEPVKNSSGLVKILHPYEIPAFMKEQNDAK